MTPARFSAARRRAVAVSGDASLVTGPLSGYHHESYVVPLLDGTKVKFREPRRSVLWFDRRYFESEDALLRSLSGRVERVPAVLASEGGLSVQTFIEGRTLAASHAPGRRVPAVILCQIVALFGQLARITPGTLGAERRRGARNHSEDGDSGGFLEWLTVFAEQQVYEGNRAEFGSLYRALGVPDDAFDRLRKHVAGLRKRPFCLLHADLHRKNLIVDPQQRLWTIDWELALFGDPLYDLATHLHLMRYPVRQERRMVQAWCAAVEEVREGSSYGYASDLQRLLAFKRVQSLFTDVIRVALSLGDAPGPGRPVLRAAARRLQEVLAAAAEPLGLENVPSRARIVAELARWHREREAP
ncbi:phosphotransferase [Streptomyces sp. MH13]|uniref:phosphotransferase n=1 Tax=Streptomyces sp. MH13 TaxID=3417651 RepID=UPI003CEE2BF7